MSEKITPLHLSRNAYVYVRQSTASQVMNHIESQHVQYNLCERAACLGWPSSQINVIDQDLGRSATGATYRLGFEQLMMNRHQNPNSKYMVMHHQLPIQRNEWFHL